MPPATIMNSEQRRVAQNHSPGERWDLWGPYLSERAWGTVREDYSPSGDAWNYFPHVDARSRAYRWNEDGIGGICDFKQRLCFAFAFWNECDPFLKEHFFGVTGPQGNHGEDVKELYWYIDNTPSHSFMRMIYRYPQTLFPYEELVAQNATRSKQDSEFELWHTSALKGGFFDIEIDYAKNSTDDILIRATATNCGSSAARLHILPTLWFRNTWSWGRDERRPNLHIGRDGSSKIRIIEASHDLLGEYRLYCDDADELLFTENESNAERLWGVPNATLFVKDSINDYVVRGKKNAVNPGCVGTKAAAHYKIELSPEESRTIRLRLKQITTAEKSFRRFAKFDDLFAQRAREADEFYAALAPSCLSNEHCAIQRQALAGMLWSKQFYHYIGVFDRSAKLPDGSRLEQSDGTSWMGMFCLNMLRIAVELARENAVYENIATKFFEHFLGIAAAMNNLGGKGIGLWDEQDEFYYDVLHTPGAGYLRVRVRSLIGLMPLLAVETIEPALLDALPGFKQRLEWYLTNQPHLCSLISR